MEKYKNTVYVCVGVCVVLMLFFWGKIFGITNLAIACPNKFEFISPDLNCTEDAQDQVVNLQGLVNRVIENDKLIGRASRVSVFYRDLDSKQWFGVHENDNFAPGSLLKLPLAMAYYKYAEIDPGVFQKNIQYVADPTKGDLNDLQHTKSLFNILSFGSYYSVDFLIRAMLQYSDNNPVPLLVDNLGDNRFLSKVYIDLGVYIPIKGGVEQDFVSVKTYGAIFRTLYNASYLNQASSNSLLSIMGESSFKDGLVAGVPGDTKVSHKFGERFDLSDSDVDNNFELHDCGVVYAPKSAYILCVMTKGSEYEDLTKTIADISKVVYDNQ